jgi:hypothetical protein
MANIPSAMVFFKHFKNAAMQVKCKFVPRIIVLVSSLHRDVQIFSRYFDCTFIKKLGPAICSLMQPFFSE